MGTPSLICEFVERTLQKRDRDELKEKRWFPFNREPGSGGFGRLTGPPSPDFDRSSGLFLTFSGPVSNKSNLKARNGVLRFAKAGKVTSTA
jgi:hypothetical protein